MNRSRFMSIDKVPTVLLEKDRFSRSAEFCYNDRSGGGNDGDRSWKKMKKKTRRALRIGGTLLFIAVSAGFSFSNSFPQAKVRPEWRAWIRANHHALTTLDVNTLDDSDLDFLQKTLSGKRIVGLGESGHGVSEFSAAKVRLVKYLHENLGFDVIAFESSIFECFAADRLAAVRPAETTLRDAVFGVWHTEETLELFEYLRTTKETDHPLVLAGFDVQISSLRGAAGRPAAFREAVAKVDLAFAETVYDRDSTFIRNYGDPAWIAVNGPAFKTFYSNLAWWMEARREALAAAYRAEPEIPKVLLQTVRSMGPFIDELLAEGVDQTNYRDKGMADNVDVLADIIYPGRKIILWSHNYHLQYDAGEEQGDGNLRTMGWWLDKRRRADVYSIGLFSGRGTACWNNRIEYALTPVRNNSLESVFESAEKSPAFLDLIGTAPNGFNNWLFSPLPAKSWGYFDVVITPAGQYDGILFFRNVHPPRYLTSGS